MGNYLPLFLMATLLSCQAQAASDVRFMVLSDLHVQADPASRMLLDSALTRVSQAQPDLLFITGDLADQGDQATHDYVATHLYNIELQGTQVYVIPGNHDLYASAISPEAFASCYAAFGYDEAVLRHEGSLSYLAYPCPGLALLCLDSTRPADASGRHSDGGLTDATLTWAEAAAAQAKADGRTLIAMMHHQLVEHFDHQSDVDPTHIANTDPDFYPTQASAHDRLIAAGIRVMLTGHFHTQSIQHVVTDAGELHDISTGSLYSYPSPIRSATLTPEGLLSVTSDTLSLYRAEQRIRNEQAVSTLFARGAARLYPKMNSLKAKIPAMFLSMLKLPASEAEMAKDMSQYMLTAMTDVFCAFAAGDEDQHDPEALYTSATDAMNQYFLSVCRGNQMLSSLMMQMLTEMDDEGYLSQFDATLRSIVHNYRDDVANVVADNAITLQLPVTSGLDSIPADSSQPTVRYTLDGKRLPANAESPRLSISNNQIICR